MNGNTVVEEELDVEDWGGWGGTCVCVTTAASCTTNIMIQPLDTTKFKKMHPGRI